MNQAPQTDATCLCCLQSQPRRNNRPRAAESAILEGISHVHRPQTEYTGRQDKVAAGQPRQIWNFICGGLCYGMVGSFQGYRSVEAAGWST